MEVTIEHKGSVRFEAAARGHKVLCDQPLESGGSNEGMTPPEFLLAALGTCAGFYAAQYLKVRQLPQTGLKVRVLADKKPAPARLDSFRIELSVPGLSAEHEAGVLRAVKACLIHNTLLNQPQIETTIMRERQTEAA